MIVLMSQLEHATLDHDELKTFMDSRYVSAPEAAWRLFAFKMHEQSHTIVRLQVHLPNEQNVYFTEDNMQAVATREQERDTNLTAWFKLNAEEEDTRNYLYIDIPKYYVFEEKLRKWKPRQRRQNKTIGRMYSVSLRSDVERFCLRLLLLHVPGATSYEHLRTVNNITYSSFKEAAQKRCLFNNDEIWNETLTEAASIKMPRQLRERFAYICVFVVPPNVAELFNKYKEELSEDIVMKHGNNHSSNCANCENITLELIQDTMKIFGKKCSDFGLPNPPLSCRTAPMCI